MLSPFQKKTAAFAITCVSVCAILAFAVLVVELFGAFLEKFSLVVWPLATAAILSIIIKPIIDFLSTRLGMSRTSACVATSAALAVVVSAAALLLLPRAVSELIALAESLPGAVREAAAGIASAHPELRDKITGAAAALPVEDFAQKLAHGASKILSQSLKTIVGATNFAIGAAGAAAAFAVVPIYLFYMLISEKSSLSNIEQNLSFLRPKHRRDIVFLMTQFAEIMATFFRGQLLIALLIGIMLSLGFGIAGIKFGFLIGFFVGVINIVPYLGTIIGLATVLPLAYLQDGGGIVLAAAALAIFCIVQLIEAYILTPKIMGNRTGLHPMTIIFSVFFWGTALGGMLGMILAIPLSAFVVVIWKLIKEQYLPEIFLEREDGNGTREGSE